MNNKISSMILYWALWDALGIPVEMRTREEIQSIMWEWNTLRDFRPAKENYFFSKHKASLCDDEIWLVSDDTILTIATIRSLVEKWSIELDDIMEKHMNAYDSFPFWFWGGTRNAIAYFRENSTIKWFLDTEIIDPKKKVGMWNGVIMKQSPLAAYNATDEEVVLYTKMTHNHPTSIVASLVHNFFLKKLLKNSSGGIDVKESLEKLIEVATRYSDEYIWERELPRVENIYKKIMTFLNDDGMLDISEEEILDSFWWWNEKIFASWNVITTLWITYCVFLRKLSFESLIDAINIWWDTDTYGAIVWNMLWALSGKRPDDSYLSKLRDKKEIEESINSFTSLIENQRNT